MKLFFVFFLLVIILFPPLLAAMDWPSSGVLTRNFGWNNRGLPHLGVTIEDSGEFRSAEVGELLYRRREGDTASRLPSPLGSWAALDHGDGIISIYSRFDDASSREIEGQVEKGQALGEAGISGWSGRTGFYFQLFDRKERRWINPSMIITPPEDTRPPVIQSVRLRNEQGRLFDLFQTRILSQGRYVILVEAVDTMRLPNESPLAPYRIICSLNGSEAGSLNFETYSSRDGSLMVYRNGLVPVKRVYAPFPGYEVAELWLSRGQISLEIIAQDIAGNTRNVVFRLMVE